jgi:hypothetical protein
LRAHTERRSRQADLDGPQSNAPRRRSSSVRSTALAVSAIARATSRCGDHRTRVPVG